MLTEYEYACAAEQITDNARWEWWWFIEELGAMFPQTRAVLDTEAVKAEPMWRTWFQGVAS